MLRALLGRAGAAGIDPGGLLARWNLDPALLEEVDGRAPAAAVRALWEELPTACGDPELGLNLAAAVPDAALGIVAYLVLHAPTLGQGLVAAVRHARLLQDVADCFVEPVARGLRFVQAPLPNGPAPPRQAVEFAFARFVHLARRSTGLEVRPALVRFAFSRPADIHPHQALFACPLHFDHPRNELELDTATLDLPQRAADSWLRALIEKQAQALHERLGKRPRFAAAVRAALMIEMQKGQGDLASVGRALTLGKRTLQRGLHREGVSFRALTDEVRRGLAAQYLADGRISLAEIALLLGFSEQAAFQRAFLRWTGVTPGQYRRGERACASGVNGQSPSLSVKTNPPEKVTLSG